MTDEYVAPVQSLSGMRQWALILVAIGALAFALFVGTPVIGALMALVSPPMPPLPPTSSQITQQIDTYGYERWVFEANSFPDSVLAFYAESGADCEVAPFTDARTTQLRSEFTEASVLQGYCTGERTFDRFEMRWAALVSSSTGDTRTRLDVVRRIDWFSSSP